MPGLKKDFLSKFMVGLGVFLTYIALSTNGAHSAEYFVDRNHASANDSNPGTQVLPWRTIQRAANVMQHGDTCYVNPGTYEERVQPQNSGQQGNPITYKAVGTVVMRGFYLSARTYIRIIGFEITHTSFNQYPGIELRSAHGCEILDNYIHHTYSIGIWLYKTAPCNNVLIRGNRIAYPGAVPGRQLGEIAIHAAGSFNIIEYNDISHTADFTNAWGEYNIFRNNYFHDCYLSDYPDYTVAEGHHIDGLQYYSALNGSTPLLLNRTMFEGNFINSNDVPHAHVIILRDTSNHGSSEFLFRGNLAVRNGSYGGIIDYFDRFRSIHNTFVDMLNQQPTKAMYCISFSAGATGGKVFNNVFHNSARSGGMLYYVDSSSLSGFYADYNLAYLSGNFSEAHGILNQDPQFVNYSGNDLHLRNTSPAIDRAGPITRTASAGSGTLITVQDANYFTDGWDIAEGDIIKVGANNPVTITDIDYANNRLTVGSSISWSANDAVNLAYIGAGADMGAFEYRNGGYDYGISMTSPMNGAIVRAPVDLQASVTNADCVRFVIFYVNGIPVAKVERAPYTYSMSGTQDGMYTIEARAYSRYPDSALSKSAKIEIGVGVVGVRPAAPMNLKVK